MSNLYRLVPRMTSSIFYVSRMNAHNSPPGSSVKTPEAKSGNHTVSGSGQSVARDGPSATTKTGTGSGSNPSVLPGAQTTQDKTNPMKTSEDAKHSQGSKGGPDQAYEERH